MPLGQAQIARRFERIGRVIPLFGVIGVIAQKIHALVTLQVCDLKDQIFLDNMRPRRSCCDSFVQDDVFTSDIY